ncbi:MAG: hypothetical protein J5736_02545, partial [Bacilli bacterium]|nr:hypothetical protein [Bacilli bacterium]
NCEGLRLSFERELKLGGCFFDFALKFGEGEDASYAFLEIQSLDISGSAQREVDKLFQVSFGSSKKRKPVGPNWQMSIKTLFMELLKKERIAHELDASLYVAVQDGLWEYIERKYGRHIGKGIHFLIYEFPLNGGLRLKKEFELSSKNLIQMILSEDFGDVVEMRRKLRDSLKTENE